MLFFLATYFAVFGALNYYIFRKVRHAFVLRRIAASLFAGFLVLTMLLPLLSRLWERDGAFLPALVASVTAYLWLLFVLWFVGFGVPLDLVRQSVRLLAGRLPSAKRFQLSERKFALVVMLLYPLLGAWGWIEANHLRLTTHHVRTAALPPGSPPLRVAQVSDVHLGLLVGEARIGQIRDLLRQASPDLLVVTGDLIDSPDGCLASRLPSLAALASSGAPLGSFAVIGNHEYYAGVDACTGLISRAGFTVLRNEVRMLSHHGVPVRLAGLDDPAGWEMGEAPRPDEGQFLPSATERPLTILLKHRPTIREPFVSRFDVQLSGHTHGGQIFPFDLIMRVFYRYAGGLYQLGSGACLCVSYGVGTWGPPVRLFAPPEVVLLVIEPSGN